MKPRKRGG